MIEEPREGVAWIFTLLIVKRGCSSKTKRMKVQRNAEKAYMYEYHVRSRTLPDNYPSALGESFTGKIALGTDFSNTVSPLSRSGTSPVAPPKGADGYRTRSGNEVDGGANRMPSLTVRRWPRC
jgi:hypothetical protein